MNTNMHELIYRDEVFNIIGCAMEVLNSLGCGLLEKPYENALIEEFRIRGIPFQQQQRFNVIYKSIIVGEYIPDVTAFNKIIVEVKTVNHITNIERAQVLNYLKLTGFRLGLILNFNKPKLEWERIII